MREFGLNGATTGTADLLTDLRAAREAEYDVLEIRDTKVRAYLEAGGRLEWFRTALQEARVRVYTVNAIEHSTHVGDPDRMGPLLDRCTVFCEYARAVGAPYVVAVPSFLNEVADPERIVDDAAAALRAMADVASRFGVGIGFEFLGFQDCSVNTLAAARTVVDRAGRPNVGVVIDAFHYYAGGSTPEMLVGLDPARLFIVHLDDAEDRPRAELRDAHRLLPGDGVIPLRDLVRRIEALGYAGPWSIELFRPEYWSWDPVHLARVSREKMAALFE
jgi:2-keto-myo-inositol isomerase